MTTTFPPFQEVENEYRRWRATELYAGRRIGRGPDREPRRHRVRRRPGLSLPRPRRLVPLSLGR